MATCIKDGQTVLFIGDSITDCERRVGVHGPLGWGYVRMFADLLSVREPEKQVRVINKGVDGNTIAHLLSRWCDDVIEYRPDVLCVLIGINDVTRRLDGSASLHCPPQEFGDVYRRLVLETGARLPGCRVLLLEPFFISRGDDMPGSYRNRLIRALDEYSRNTEAVARACGVRLVRLGDVFQRLLRHRSSATYSEDKVHPNPAGHLAIAEAIYHELREDEPGHV